MRPSGLVVILYFYTQLKRIAPLDILKEEASGNDDSFDTDFAIMTGELKKLLPVVIDAQGDKQRNGLV